MQFKPDFSLLKYDKPSKRHEPPYVARYRRGNKTLIYMADYHDEEKSWNMVDWCFSKDFGYTPDILLTEFENAGRELKAFKTNTLTHAAFVAARNDVPVVLSDLSEQEMLSVLGKDADSEYLSKVLSVGPIENGNDLQKQGAKLNRQGRDRFMLENIAAALNKYDTVFCILGEGHFISQRDVLDKMFESKPEYIDDFPKLRTDFGKKNIFYKAVNSIRNKIHPMNTVNLVKFKGGVENG